MSEVRKRDKNKPANDNGPHQKKEEPKHAPASPTQPPNQAQTSTPPKSRFQTFAIRFIVGLLMLIFGGLIISADHSIVAIFVVALQVFVFREMTGLRYKAVKEQKLWGFRTLQWYFLAATFFWLYGKQSILFFRARFPDAALLNNDILLNNHNWHSFVLYCAGFLGTVFSMRSKTLKYQLGQITWTLMILLLVVIQPQFTSNNIFEGLIWFVLPHSLIICNDIWAYFVGFAIGKKFFDRPLTRLSPNKTWEGFIGGCIATLIFGFIFAGILANYDWFRCSYAALQTYNGTCETSPLFLPATIGSIFKPTFLAEYVPPFMASIQVKPIQLHALVFALFASFVAPFGGFLASAIKRAYQIKDFDQLFPGHGGITDRIDCQMPMGFFTYMYYTTFLKPQVIDLAFVLSAISALSREQQGIVLQYLEEQLH